MYVNIFFSEEDIADVIYIPEKMGDISLLQTEFLDWLFDKENNHEFWVNINGEKTYCKYGTDAFVKWINDKKLYASLEKAKVEKRNCKNFCKRNQKIFF